MKTLRRKFFTRWDKFGQKFYRKIILVVGTLCVDINYHVRLFVRRAVRFCIQLLLILSIAGGLVGGIASQVPMARDIFASRFAQINLGSRLDQFLAGLGFRISDVTLAGRVRAERGALRLAVGAVRGASIWKLDLSAIHARLISVPWVHAAHVRRVLPDIVHIELAEYEPYALLSREGTKILIARDGQHIIRDDSDFWRGLPEVSGVGAEFEAAQILEILDRFSLIRSRLRLAEWYNGRRWTLHLDRGVMIYLPAEDIALGLHQLMVLERQRSVLHVADQIIDLRLSGQIVLGRRGDLPFDSNVRRPRAKLEVSL